MRLGACLDVPAGENSLSWTEGKADFKNTEIVWPSDEGAWFGGRAVGACTSSASYCLGDFGHLTYTLETCEMGMVIVFTLKSCQEAKTRQCM